MYTFVCVCVQEVWDIYRIIHWSKAIL